MLSPPHVTTGARDVVTCGWGGVRLPFAPWRIARCAFGNPVRFPLGMQARRSSLLVSQGYATPNGESRLLCTIGARFCSTRTVALAFACGNPAKRVSEAPLTVRPAITLHSAQRRKRVVTTGVCDNGGR
jgi:hypothetical protein